MLSDEPMQQLAEDIQAGLQQAGLSEAFTALAPSHQREYLKWIDEAKKPETRANRITKMIEMVRAKQQ